MILPRHITAEDIQSGMNFFSNDNEFIQVGFSHHDESGKEIKPHIHNTVERKVSRTCEVLYVVKGALDVVVYDTDKIMVKKLTVKRGETLILLEGGHGFFIKEDDTVILEVKNGPYLGAEMDRHRI